MLSCDWKAVGGNPKYVHPGGQISIFLPKLTLNMGNILTSALFVPYDNEKNTFKLNHDIILSE